MDPEAFFGSDTGYFVDVLFENEDDDDDTPADHCRLLVLEDCGELLTADARERSGQGLARLLNLVDGLIGQGLRLDVLITTNEPLTSFHPAISRPGRCGAVVAFDLFDREEAADWLARHEVLAAAPARSTLADLFALRDGRELAPERPPIGFEVGSRVE